MRQVCPRSRAGFLLGTLVSISLEDDGDDLTADECGAVLITGSWSARVGQLIEGVTHALEACALLGIGFHDDPRAEGGVRFGNMSLFVVRVEESQRSSACSVGGGGLSSTV